MLKCPVCGCCDFPNQDTTRDFPCPVIGCNGTVHVKTPEGFTAVFMPPPTPNGSAIWMNKKISKP